MSTLVNLRRGAAMRMTLAGAALAALVIFATGVLAGARPEDAVSEEAALEKKFPVPPDRRPAGVLQEKLDNRPRAVLPAGVTLRAIKSEHLEVTKAAEGWVPHLYNDPAGYCTIGYGHLIKKSRCDFRTEPASFLDGMTAKEGEDWLRADMADAQKTVMLQTMLLPGSRKIELTDGQYAALCDFTFNVGGANFRSSTLLEKVQARKFDQVAAQFRRWIKADGVVLSGLRKRREDEIKLFFNGNSPRGAAEPGEDSELEIDVPQAATP